MSRCRKYLGVCPRDEEPHDEQAEQRSGTDSRETRLDLQQQTLRTSHLFILANIFFRHRFLFADTTDKSGAESEGLFYYGIPINAHFLN